MEAQPASAIDPPAGCPAATAYLPWTDPQFREDPYPFYARAQAEAPVMWDEDGCYVLMKYDDLMRYGRLPSLLSAPEWEGAFGAWSILKDAALGTDDPAHKRIRRRTNRWYTPKMVRSWDPMIAEIAGEILDRIGPDGVVDGSALAVEATHRTICRILQVPDDETDEVRRNMREAMPVLSARPAPRDFEGVDEALTYLSERTAASIAFKRANPGDGVLDDLLATADSGELSEAELFAITLFYYAVGHMDASYMICSALRFFAQKPELMETFRSEPQLRGAMVSEVARMDAPEHFITRLTSEEMTVRGITIPPGSRLRLMLSAANRDPDVFADPDVFDPRRPAEQSRNLTFGFGSHGCQGQLLAESMVRIVLEQLVERYRRIVVTSAPSMLNTDASRHYLTLPLALRG